jgi:hypothetical protein
VIHPKRLQIPALHRLTSGYRAVAESPSIQLILRFFANPWMLVTKPLRSDHYPGTKGLPDLLCDIMCRQCQCAGVHGHCNNDAGQCQTQQRNNDRDYF